MVQKLEHMNKREARLYERSLFDLAASKRPEQFIYTPTIMLLNNGYACQPDALTKDYSIALEIKSRRGKHFEAISSGSLSHPYMRVTYKYFLANPYLELLVFFFFNREDNSYLFREFHRPAEYEFQIKRAHKDASKIKGDYQVIDLGNLSRSQAMRILSYYKTEQGR